jgi:hypothetical protein
MNGREWTDEEKRILEAMFPDHYTGDICKLLGRGYFGVACKAKQMGLEKSEAFKKMELGKQAERLKRDGVAHRWTKGTEPPNKGKKMPASVYKKVQGTMFKTGHLPHNTNYDGHERITIDGYVEVRIRAGKYVLKHRLIWEQVNGPIPAGMLLVFKDKNPQHIAIDNLELITMADNMRRNSIHRFPPELKQAIHLVKKVNKLIHEKQN